MIKNRLKNEKGITLIALIITIIVLLILAGITIGMLTSNNGVLKQGTNARSDTIKGQEKEQVELAYNSAVMKTLGEKVGAKEVQKELDKSVGENKTTVRGSTILKVKFEDTKNEYIIRQKDGTIEKYEKIDPTPVYAHVCDINGDGTGETLVLSSTEDIEGYTVTNNYGLIPEKTSRDYTYYGTNRSNTITKVIIYDKISPINTAYWFDGLIELNEIENMDYLDTSNVITMKSMFYQCEKLEELDVSKWDTSKVTNMEFLFAGCENLEDLNVSGFDTSIVTSFTCMFRDCKKLKEIDVSGFDTKNAESMNEMFNNCVNIQEIDVSGFDTSKVTNMASMFGKCNNLTKLDLSSFNTSNVTNMISMFNNCLKLESLNLSNFDTANVSSMHGMFRNCNKLKNVNLSSFNTSNVTDMGYMFYYCISIEKIDLSSFNTSKVTSITAMFDNCFKLTTIFASSEFVTSGLSESQRMFLGCDSLVGGSGTIHQMYVYYSTYAHIDGGTENPGYFTAK